MNFIFAFFILTGIVVAAVRGDIQLVTQSVANAANHGVQQAIGFIGIMSFWLGLARIAQEAGLIKLLTGILEPVIRLLFPSIPRGHRAMGSVLMNISANIMGLGSAATPFGLKAMQELQELNREKETASEAMCTFLAVNTASVTLVPATIIAFRASTGSANPGEVVGPVIFATMCASLVALTADYMFRRRNRRRKD